MGSEHGWRLRVLLIGVFTVLAASITPLPAVAPASVVEIQGLSAPQQARARSALRRYDVPLTPPVDVITADDAAFYFREVLLEDGFSDAEVTYEFAGDRLIFRVEEGARNVVGTIRVEGGAVLNSATSRAIVEAALRQETLTPFGRIPYFEHATRVASERLVAAFAQEGYLESTVRVESTPSAHRVNLEFLVKEGRRFTIGDVKVLGEGIAPEIVASLRESLGDPYRSGDEILLRGRLSDALRNSGHFQSRIRFQVERKDDATITILLDAEPGPVFRIGRLRVTGNGQVTETTFLRRLGLKEGTRYNGKAFDAALGRMWETSAFENIEPVFEPQADGTLDIKFQTEEAPAKQISTTVGYGQWDQGFVGVHYSDRNFLGSLNRFSLDAFYSAKSYGVIATLSDPWLFRGDVTGTSRAFYARRETPAYQSSIYGGALLLEKTSNLRNQTGWSAGLEWRDTSDSTVFADDQLDGALVDYRLGAVSISQTFDRRNDPLMPMKGFFLSWDGLLATEVLLGDVSFGRLRAQATYYLPLQKIQPGRAFVPFFVLNHRAGILAPFASTQSVPIQERFFLGGPNSVRSFQLDGMAPRDSEGQPGGGLLSLLWNAELQIPIFRALYFVVFADAGNLAPTLETFDWDDTRIAGGVGARFYTPLGAVRLDYGYNLIRGEGDPVGAWQFGFGFTF